MDDDFAAFDDFEDVQADILIENDGDNENFATSHPAISALNNADRVRIKLPEEYPPDDVYVHPIDWHMRMPDYAEIFELQRLELQKKEEAVNRLAQRIEMIRAQELLRSQEEESALPSLQLRGSSTGITRYATGDVLNAPPIDGSPWIGVSASDNAKRLYIRILPSQHSIDPMWRKKLTQHQTGIFATDAVAQLHSAADAIRSQRRAAPPASGVSQTQEPTPTAESSLWVEKYKPKMYIDLLSDDSVNRSVLTWLKLWDECVFKRHSSAAPHFREREKYLFETEAVKPHRPLHKILLLAGSAGVGKTTLADFLARQTGYSTVHVNASDSRNVADIQKALHGVTEMRQSLIGENRPQILLLDEIDGAPVDSINYLCKAASAVGKKALKRPVIAICNSLYAPNMRELRQQAAVVTVPAARENVLVSRLASIAAAENMTIDKHVLECLAQCAENDVRLSINTLQCLSTLKNDDYDFITEQDVIEACSKVGGGQLSLFENWAMFLDIKRHQDNRGVLKSDPERITIVERVWDKVSDQRDRFVAGLFCNYCRHQPPLPVNKLALAAQCFVFYDHVSHWIQEHQNYTMLRYFYAFYTKLHLLLTTHSKIELAYPKVDADIAQKQRNHSSTLASISNHIMDSNKRALLVDVLPILLVVSQPSIKQPNEVLMLPRERAALDFASLVLASYGVTFKHCTVSEQSVWLFDPPIDMLCMFPLQHAQRATLPNAVRETLARYVRLHVVRRMARSEVDDGEHAAAVAELVEQENNAAALESRKRKWLPSPKNADARPQKQKVVLANGVNFLHKPMGPNAVRTRVTLGQLLGL